MNLKQDSMILRRQELCQCLIQCAGCTHAHVHNYFSHCYLSFHCCSWYFLLVRLLGYGPLLGILGLFRNVSTDYFPVGKFLFVQYKTFHENLFLLMRTILRSRMESVVRTTATKIASSLGTVSPHLTFSVSKLDIYS